MDVNGMDDNDQFFGNFLIAGPGYNHFQYLKLAFATLYRRCSISQKICCLYCANLLLAGENLLVLYFCVIH